MANAKLNNLQGALIKMAEAEKNKPNNLMRATRALKKKGNKNKKDFIGLGGTWKTTKHPWMNAPSTTPYSNQYGKGIAGMQQQKRVYTKDPALTAFLAPRQGKGFVSGFEYEYRETYDSLDWQLMISFQGKPVIQKMINHQLLDGYTQEGVRQRVEMEVISEIKTNPALVSLLDYNNQPPNHYPTYSREDPF